MRRLLLQILLAFICAPLLLCGLAMTAASAADDDVVPQPAPLFGSADPDADIDPDIDPDLDPDIDLDTQVDPQARADLVLETTLAERYAPQMNMVKQFEPCGPGDPYRPSAVEPMFDNVGIGLRGPWAPRDLVTVAPSESELSQGLTGYSLDMPHDPLTPGCDFDKWSKVTWAGTPTTIYAHVAREPGHPDQLALQYYFFYPFNDFNNKHEGDWERIQLEFDVGTVEEALATQPVRAVYSQHYGAEFAPWGDKKIEMVPSETGPATHPVVYVSEGSHASQFSSGLVIGRNAEQGFGCDNTAGEQVEWTPEVAVISSNRALAREQFPWTNYRGHWGELGPKGFYEGPTGPTMKAGWHRPFTWTSTARESSFVVPGGDAYDGGATDVFCTAVEAGSNVYRIFSVNPWPVLVVLGALVLAASWLVRRTSWADSHPIPVRQVRLAGQIIADSWQVYRQHWWLMLKIGSPAAAVAGTFGLGAVLAPPGQTVAILTVISGGALLAANAMAHSATSQALNVLDTGLPKMREAYALAFRRWVPTLATLAVFSVIIGALTVSFWLVPVALVLGIAWSLWNAVTQLEDRAIFSAYVRSWRLVRPQWLTVTVVLALSALVGSFVGGILAALLFLVVQVPATLLNLLPGLISTVLQPFIALMLTYAYFGGLAREGLPSESDDAGDSGSDDHFAESPA